MKRFELLEEDVATTPVAEADHTEPSDVIDGKAPSEEVETDEDEDETESE